MCNNQLQLSLCIPTNGVTKWVIPVIDSIYAQGIDNSLFEIVVTDNGKGLELENAVKCYTQANFHYYRTNSQGYYNQIDSFEKCNGIFCKMLNHRSVLMPGSIERLLNIIKQYKESKPIIYCAEGFAKGGGVIECNNTDEFVKCMGYYLSWSAGTGVWKSDLNNIRLKHIDSFFPHLVFLLGLRDETKYVIWNEKYSQMISDPRQGGYDLFQMFGVHFLDIINDLRIRERISSDAFLSVKKELYTFLKELYFNESVMPTTHSFIIKDVKKNVGIYYGDYYYMKMVFIARIKKPFAHVKRFLRNLF